MCRRSQWCPGRETKLADLGSVLPARVLALVQLIFLGIALNTDWLEGLYITASVFLPDKSFLTLLLTKTPNYCLPPALVDNKYICLVTLSVSKRMSD